MSEPGDEASTRCALNCDIYMYLLQFSQCAVHLQCTSKMNHTFITNLFKWNTLEEHNKSFGGTSGGIKTLSSYLNEVK